MRPLVVVLTGPESTGKTTLAAHLAARFDAPWSAEGARAWYAERLAADPAATLSYETVTPIAERQIALEEGALADATRRGSPLVLRDTDLLSTVTYARMLYGSAPPWVEEAAWARRGDHYLLGDVDAPWVEDPVRADALDRDVARATFEAVLREFGCAYEVLGGADWEARLDLAESLVGRWLSKSIGQD
ncbi:ATP-binding protein [Roseisolibacter sp. H3M3-2]|uniref:ATP-binding protein n=1 Tax=Roseisolibacter sp. H3M3-2 TaxID=3031323 RepID=UPI0023DAB728|nr:ATP-binding protein [Roseisolibacter sp. H3M3-2]MDF1502184.1 ATP-binding protein [Roseisolibacter sp. H3M3-2]